MTTLAKSYLRQKIDDLLAKWGDPDKRPANVTLTTIAAYCQNCDTTIYLGINEHADPLTVGNCGLCGKRVA